MLVLLKLNKQEKKTQNLFTSKMQGSLCTLLAPVMVMKVRLDGMRFTRASDLFLNPRIV